VVAYSKGSWSRLFATPRQALPPKLYATFYATIGQKTLYLSVKPRSGTILLGELSSLGPAPARMSLSCAPCGGKHRPLQYSLDDRAGNALSPIER